MCTGNDAQDFALVDVTDVGSDQAHDRSMSRDVLGRYLLQFYALSIVQV